MRHSTTFAMRRFSLARAIVVVRRSIEIATEPWYAATMVAPVGVDAPRSRTQGERSWILDRNGYERQRQFHGVDEWEGTGGESRLPLSKAFRCLDAISDHQGPRT